MTRRARRAQFDLLQIRKLKAARFASVFDNPEANLGNYSELSEALKQLERYERRAFSRRKSALFARINK